VGGGAETESTLMLAENVNAVLPTALIFLHFYVTLNKALMIFFSKYTMRNQNVSNEKRSYEI
jgi:hypothetical protein